MKRSNNVRWIGHFSVRFHFKNVFHWNTCYLIFILFSDTRKRRPRSIKWFYFSSVFPFSFLFSLRFNFYLWFGLNLLSSVKHNLNNHFIYWGIEWFFSFIFFFSFNYFIFLLLFEVEIDSFIKIVFYLILFFFSWSEWLEDNPSSLRPFTYEWWMQ